MPTLRKYLLKKLPDYSTENTVSIYFPGKNLEWIDKMALGDERSRAYIVNKIVEYVKTREKLTLEIFPGLQGR